MVVKLSGITIRPAFGARANSVMRRSMSAGARACTAIASTAKAGAAASNGRRKSNPAFMLASGLNSSATRLRLGAIC
jgi:hypothetical protein